MKFGERVLEVQPLAAPQPTPREGARWAPQASSCPSAPRAPIVRPDLVSLPWHCTAAGSRACAWASRTRPPRGGCARVAM